MTSIDDPHGVHRDTAAAARIYDYVLGGALNLDVDRQAARRILTTFPGYRDFVIANRAFLRRAVLHLLGLGIRQFLDLGSGLPTVGPVHEIAHRVDSRCHIVYVDNDPVAVELSRMITDGDERIGVVEADLRQVDVVLGHDVVSEVLDLSQPVGLLMVAVLHFVPNADDPGRLLAAYHDRLAAGSWLVASHATGDSLGADSTEAAEQSFAHVGVEVTARARGQFAALLGPWNVTDDGVVHTNRWRMEGITSQSAEACLGYAVMAAHARTSG